MSKARNNKDDHYRNLCTHFESNKRSKEYVAHQAKASDDLPEWSRDVNHVVRYTLLDGAVTEHD